MTLNIFGFYLFFILTILFSILAIYNSCQPVYVFANSTIRVHEHDEHDHKVRTCMCLAILSLIALLITIKTPTWLELSLSNDFGVFILLLSLAFITIVLRILLESIICAFTNRRSIRPLHCK